MVKSHVKVDEDGKETASFKLTVESGNFRDGEVIVLMVENGTGKTTFIELLAERSKEQRGNEATIGQHADAIKKGVDPSLAALGVAYKMQGQSPKI